MIATKNTKPAAKPERPTTRKLVVIRGRGTANERRIETDVDLFLDRATGLWMTVPADED